MDRDTLVWSTRYCRSCHKRYYACQSRKKGIKLYDSIKFCPDCQLTITHPLMVAHMKRENIEEHPSDTTKVSLEEQMILQDAINTLPKHLQKAVRYFLQNGSFWKHGKRSGSQEQRFYEALRRLRNTKHR